MEAHVGAAEIALVMGHRDDGLSCLLEVRQDLAIKSLARGGILVSSPFIQEEDGSILGQCDSQRQTFALPRR